MADFSWSTDAFKHAKECYPEECCGLVIDDEGIETYWKCKNISKNYIPEGIVRSITQKKDISNFGTSLLVTCAKPHNLPNMINIKIMGSNNFDGIYKNAKTFPGSTSRRCPDISKSKEILNYTPKVSLVDGLENTINWYNNFFDSGAKTFESSFKRPN